MKQPFWNTRIAIRKSSNLSVNYVKTTKYSIKKSKTLRATRHNLPQEIMSETDIGKFKEYVNHGPWLS